MNILFATDYDITPYMGGIERVTINLVKELKQRGHSCYSVYYQTTDSEACDDFVKKYRLDSNRLYAQLFDIITENHINSCVVNLAAKKNISVFNPTLYDVTRKIGAVKVIVGFYNFPGFELFGLSPSLAWHRLTHGNCNVTTLNGIVTGLCNKIHCNEPIKKEISRKLRRCLFSDEILLLSERYFPYFKQYVNSDSIPNVVGIGNPLSYETVIEKSKIEQKEKIVLQVARFDDNFKRQTTALEIWKKIENSQKFHDWKLIIVGYGPDEDYIKKKWKKLGLKNATILPAQNPVELLNKASIYMLTSAFEGLPMIVLDAQQFGVTPIGFDSFAAIYDIIEDGKNGFIIPNNRLDLYAEKMMWLMEHKQEREQMAICGLETCQKFEKTKIVDQWERILRSPMIE